MVEEVSNKYQMVEIVPSNPIPLAEHQPPKKSAHHDASVILDFHLLFMSSQCSYMSMQN